jgi:hypothetical protein
MKAKPVLLVDAGLDTTLAVLCVLLATALSGWARPDWLGPTVLLVLAAVLIALAAGLLWLARRPDAVALRALGVGNGGSAVVLLVWGLSDGAVGTELRVLVVLAAVALAAVAAAQLVAARRLGRLVTG